MDRVTTVAIFGEQEDAERALKELSDLGIEETDTTYVFGSEDRGVIFDNRFGERPEVYEEHVRLGKVVVAAASDKPSEVRDIFKKLGAEDIREYKHDNGHG